MGILAQDVAAHPDGVPALAARPVLDGLEELSAHPLPPVRLLHHETADLRASIALHQVPDGGMRPAHQGGAPLADDHGMILTAQDLPQAVANLLAGGRVAELPAQPCDDAGILGAGGADHEP